MSIKKMLVTALLTISATAQAGIIVGGSTLVDAAGQTQLETWLGQGQLTLTKIFTKTSGSTALDFHAAADGQGATFSLMSASEDNGATWKTIGGYNPLSWTSSSTYNESQNPIDWNAFIFNLTDTVKKQQSNQYQTYNYINYGPTFGGGHDINLDYTLSTGYSLGYSYGSLDWTSIVDGSAFNGFDMKIGSLEVFTIAGFTPVANAVPEPATISLLGMGLLGWAATRRRKAKTA